MRNHSNVTRQSAVYFRCMQRPVQYLGQQVLIRCGLSNGVFLVFLRAQTLKKIALQLLKPKPVEKCNLSLQARAWSAIVLTPPSTH